MTSTAEKLEQAIQSLKHANGLQQEAFAQYEGALPDDEDVSYQIHDSIEELIDGIQEILDQIKEPV